MTEGNEGPLVPAFPDSLLQTYVVKSITFDIGRWGTLQHTLHFEKAIDGVAAIQAVERWLSEPLTKTEHAALLEADDLYDDNMTYDEYENRGAALSACTFLDVVEYNPQRRHITLSCGS